MRRFNDLPVWLKTVLPVASMCVLAILATVFMMRAMEDAQQGYGLIINEFGKAEQEAIQAQVVIERLPALGYQLIAETDDVRMATIKAELDTLPALFSRHLDAVARHLQGEDASADIDAIHKAFSSAYSIAMDKAAPLALKNQNVEATRIMAAEFAPNLVALGTTAETFQSKIENLINARIEDEKDKIASTTTVTLTTVGVGIVVLLGISVMMALSGIARPIGALVQVMARIVEKDWSTNIPHLGQKDEIGRVAEAVRVFKEQGMTAERLATEAEDNRRREAAAKAEQEEAESRAREAEKRRLAEDLKRAEAERERAQSIEAAVARFEGKMGTIVGGLSGAADALKGNARRLSDLSGQTTHQAIAVASASEQASSNVQTVASATDELTTTSREIGRQAQHSAEMSVRAVELVKQSTVNVRGLEDAADQIGSVAQLIEQIAGQTNLLALNATIEAARAGEAGKGFAVVASEVKSLATQTARATEQIATQIQNIQNATRNAVTAMDDIGATIESMSHVTTTIASAIEEQIVATAEIARSIEQAAQGTQTVSSGIHEVNRAADDTSSASGEVLGAANDLGQQAETLRHSVDDFIGTVKAA